MSQLLLFSASGYKDTGYLVHTREYIAEFLKENNLENEDILFIPFAGIRRTNDEYEQKVQEALNKTNVKSIHRFENMKEAVRSAKVILVGGGNSFALLNSLYKHDLLKEIYDRVNSNEAVYIGWSAGSNLAGNTIMTTNDMPIVEPESFKALGLFPYQINPHFISGKIPGHNGESREERLQEYLIVNQEDKVYCIPEGSAIKYVNGKVKIIGHNDAFILTYPMQQQILELNKEY